MREKDLKRIDTYCEPCDKYFEELRGLERHHKTMHNTSESVYSCNTCNEVSLLRKYLIRELIKC